MRKISTVCLCATLIIGASSTAGYTVWAQESASPEPVTHNGVTYVTGGVGQDESAAIRAMAPDFNLRVRFTTDRGEYLSGVDVIIRSASGATMVALKSDGPFLFVRLAPGHYRISVGTERSIENRWITVPPRGAAEVDFYLG